MSVTLDQICVPIETSLQKLEPSLVQYVRSEVPLIEDVTQYVIRNGGKRLRPVLTLLSAELCQTQADAAIPYACAIEYIHTASLLHDDVIDKASLRRGQPSANAKWGNNVSVLVGDFFYCKASELLIEAGRLDVLSLISQAITRTTEGEVLEICKSNSLDTTEAEYLKIVYCKTAVLMGAAMEAGACLAEKPEWREACRHYGENLGMAFQLADDVLDYTSQDYKFGKENGIDLKEGRLTLPFIYAFTSSDQNDRDFLASLFHAKDLGGEDLDRVRTIMDRYGIVKRVHESARQYSQKAQDAISLLPKNAASHALISLADYVVERTH